jgi:steroid delta-isomerase-like uncharacterized protein
MSDQPKQIARRFAETFATGDTAVLAQVVAEDVVDDNPRPGQRRGRQAVVDAVTAFAHGLTDRTVVVEQEIAEGDLVAQYGTLCGIHTGDLFGLPATNQRVTLAWIDIHKIANEQIVESWHLEDIAGLLAQMR